MKKTLLVCSTVLLLFSLTACGNDKKSEKTNSVKTEKKQVHKSKEKKIAKNKDSNKSSNDEKVVENNNTQSSSNNDNSKKTSNDDDNINEPSKNTSSNTQANSDENTTNDGKSDNKKPYNIDDPSPEAQKATKDGMAAADAVRDTNPQEYNAEIARVDAGTSDVAHEPMLGQAEQAYRSHIDPE